MDLDSLERHLMNFIQICSLPIPIVDISISRRWFQIFLTIRSRRQRVVIRKEWERVVSNIFCLHPYFGKIPTLTNIFQMG